MKCVITMANYQGIGVDEEHLRHIFVLQDGAVAQLIQKLFDIAILYYGALLVIGGLSTPPWS